MSKKLSMSECRLLLLSECLKNYESVFQNDFIQKCFGDTKLIGDLSRKDLKGLNQLFPEKTDFSDIQKQMHQEWYFTGRVVDNGEGYYTQCEYCQQQSVRYQYICKNRLNGNEISLGGLCVGRVIYGEEKMRSTDFMKSFSTEISESKKFARYIPIQSNDKRLLYKQKVEEQQKRLQPYIDILVKLGYLKDMKFINLHTLYSGSKLITEQQEHRLVKFAIKVNTLDIPYYTEVNDMKFVNTNNRLLYQKVIHDLDINPDSTFLRNFKKEMETYPNKNFFVDEEKLHIRKV